MKHFGWKITGNHPFKCTNQLLNRLDECGSDFIEQSLEKYEQSIHMIPESMLLGNPGSHPDFFSIDFAITQDNSGLCPALIEGQAFPSIFGAAFHLENKLGANQMIHGRSLSQRKSLFKEAIFAKHERDEVIMLDEFPFEHTSGMDFEAMQLMGLRTVCIDDLRLEGDGIYYFIKNKKQYVKRIYSRFIMDSLTAENKHVVKIIFSRANVEFYGHPDWYYLISKPVLKDLLGTGLTTSSSLSDSNLSSYDGYVIKPWFGFGGDDVLISPSCEVVDKLDKSKYLLQKKVNYVPFNNRKFHHTPIFAEIRMMYARINGNYVLLNRLCRINNGGKMGVSKSDSDYFCLTIAT